MASCGSPHARATAAAGAHNHSTPAYRLPAHSPASTGALAREVTRLLSTEQKDSTYAKCFTPPLQPAFSRWAFGGLRYLSTVVVEGAGSWPNGHTVVQTLRVGGLCASGAFARLPKKENEYFPSVARFLISE